MTDLAQSRGEIRADLNSLELDPHADSSLLAGFRRALELADANDTAATSHFDLTALEDVSPPLLEPAPNGTCAASCHGKTGCWAPCLQG